MGKTQQTKKEDVDYGKVTDKEVLIARILTITKKVKQYSREYQVEKALNEGFRTEYTSKTGGDFYYTKKAEHNLPKIFRFKDDKEPEAVQDVRKGMKIALVNANVKHIQKLVDQARDIKDWENFLEKEVDYCEKRMK